MEGADRPRASFERDRHGNALLSPWDPFGKMRARHVVQVHAPPSGSRLSRYGLVRGDGFPRCEKLGRWERMPLGANVPRRRPAADASSFISRPRAFAPALQLAGRLNRNAKRKEERRVGNEGVDT